MLSFQLRSRRARIQRRQVLRGAGVAAFAPFVPILESEAQTDRQRFVTWYTPNGTIKREWYPDGDPTNYTFKRILDPVSAYKDRMIIFQGLKHTPDREENHHKQGPALMFACSHLNPGGAEWSQGISIDQVYANQVGDQTPFPSLVLTVMNGGTPRGRISFRGDNEPITPEDDPGRVFDEVFGDFEQDPGDAERLRAQKKSVLDIVSTQLTSLKTRQSTFDQRKLDAHLTSVRGIERRLETAAPACDPGAGPGGGNGVPERAEGMVDIMAAALACDMTRTISMQVAGETDNTVHRWADVGGRHHAQSHEDHREGPQEELIRINVWFQEQLARFMDNLNAVPEGGGTLLDNTLLYIGNGMGEGGPHSFTDLPVMLAGGAGGKLQMGRWLKVPDTANNRLAVSVGQTLGIDMDTFGNTDQGSGPLSDL